VPDDFLPQGVIIGVSLQGGDVLAKEFLGGLRMNGNREEKRCCKKNPTEARMYTLHDRDLSTSEVNGIVAIMTS
jgi:hypothetical protein